ncbi:MAG: histidine phosphatase family protein [Acidimicrobiia bacterium]|nr:histidine phosphatase family protein [Acidimicrobiia bacterium]
MSQSEAAEPLPETRLILIRHGESVSAVERRIGGPRTCGGLSELGRAQAERLRDRFAADDEFVPDLLIASHYPRADQTARLMAPGLGGLDVVTDDGFGEHDPGPELDGTSYREYVERFGTPNWDGDPHAELFVGGGETTAEFQLRVGASLTRVLREHRGSLIVISCHGGVIDTAFRRFLNTPPTGAFALHTLNASITEFRAPAAGNASLIRYNDSSHLAGLPTETPRSEA